MIQKGILRSVPKGTKYKGTNPKPETPRIASVRALDPKLSGSS